MYGWRWWVGVSACVALGACGGFNSDGIGSGPGDTLNTATETAASVTEPTTSASSASDSESEADSDSDSDSADTSSSPSTSATTSPSTTEDADGSSTAPDVTDTSSAGDESSSTDPSTTTTSGMVDPTNDDGGGDVCAPNAADNACFACARAACCPQLTACQGDVPCECVIDCVEAGGDPFGCFGMCGVSEANQLLAQCAAGNCEDCV